MAARFGISHYKTWQELILGLADHHHGGKILPLVMRANLTQAIVYSWARGTVKTPRADGIKIIAKAYDLNPEALAELVAKQNDHKGRA
jgi:hypothetical protein